jgi:hypothetical protein
MIHFQGDCKVLIWLTIFERGPGMSDGKKMIPEG